ncbi:Transcription factor like [Actinidia chinensis var. chinensis]|uniref:Transcription factor like n=1 Tax=Actinidia chinensis var. chinensis TaxID=1590841 RepID=A0A2R6QXK3_ACTCC|nr:Transcription factor like [Actinidia chinensis var. chinensis]
MASETGGGEGSRDEQRLSESIVYSRKSVKGPKSNKSSNFAQTTASEAALDVSSSLNRAQENRVTINLSSRSKQEMRKLRSKLESELNLVRNWVKKIEGKDGQVPLHQLSVSVLENSQGVGGNVEKEKKRTLKPKQNGKKLGGGELGHGFGLGKFSDQCSTLLDKLMKHKHGWVFNEPVDPKSLGLHDYFDIIKNPMDLGTVKSRLSKNWYKSPREFAEDVRLTFSNAMAYNPKGDDVHVMAEQLSKMFEDKWAVIEADYMRDLRLAIDHQVGLPTPTSTSRKASLLVPPPVEMRRILDRSESMISVFDPKTKPMKLTHSGRAPAPKKPKAKDPIKRDMTYEEKQKLSINLQNLPSEKLGNVVQIIKKRNSSLCQKDDEIEVDIDSVDKETLWELDRFVTNYKKSLSKIKRKTEFAIQATAGEEPITLVNNPAIVVEAPKETKTDENNLSSSSPGQVEKQGDNASRSSRTSSESGSSRDGAVFIVDDYS